MAPPEAAIERQEKRLNSKKNGGGFIFPILPILLRKSINDY
jgi:hypothetical protein